jgi:pimeloyl-ACP methyl ester carboxylesterase
MSERTAQQESWEVNGLHIEGLCWGDDGLPPLLALHGWLDNAASFAVLAPLLKDYHIVALDLTGHGKSSRRSADASYQIWDDLPEILGVVNQLGWDKFDLMGHSRGAMISSILASVIPERVNHLVLLDAVVPHAIPEAEFSSQLAKFLKDKPRGLRREGRLYPTMDAALDARTKGGLSVSLNAAQLLAQRSLQRRGEGYMWISDPRLYGASAVKVTQGQNQAILESLSMPTLLLQAENGLAHAPDIHAEAARTIKNFCAEMVAGGHHFHMEEAVDSVAARISRFLAS